MGLGPVPCLSTLYCKPLGKRGDAGLVLVLGQEPLPLDLVRGRGLAGHAGLLGLKLTAEILEACLHLRVFQRRRGTAAHGVGKSSGEQIGVEIDPLSLEVAAEAVAVAVARLLLEVLQFPPGRLGGLCEQRALERSWNTPPVRRRSRRPETLS